MSKTKRALALLCAIALSAAGLVGCDGGDEIPSPSRELPTGWSWQNPKPQGNSLESVHFVSATTGWAVGNAGTILADVFAQQTKLTGRSRP